MPELPEVEAVCSRIRPDVVGKRISRVLILRPGSTLPQSPEVLEQVAGRTIRGVERRGKNIALWLSGGLAVRVHLRMTGDLRVLPDARLHGASARVIDPDTGSSEKGYGLFVARYFNQDSVCYKNNQPIARTEWSPIVPGKTHHIAAEWNTPHLRLYVDGKVVIDAWDREKPIAPDPAKWLGLAVYDTRMAVDNLVISVPKEKK